MEIIYIIIADNQMTYEDYEEWIEAIYKNDIIAKRFKDKLNFFMECLRYDEGDPKNSPLIKEFSEKTKKFINRYNKEEQNTLRFRIENYIVKS